MKRRWDIQGVGHNWGLQLGMHIDHRDPSVTLHLPCITAVIGRCKQPGFASMPRSFSLRAARAATERDEEKEG